MTITVQSSYLSSVPTGFVGMVVDGETQNRISRTVEDAAGIAFGIACFRGTGNHGTTATPAANKFLGISIADAGQVPGLGDTADTIAQYKTIALLNEGVIFVQGSVAVAQGDPVYVTSAGAFTNVATSNTALPAHFDAALSAAGVVPIRVTRQ
jgi:hypothetical protein